MAVNKTPKQEASANNIELIKINFDLLTKNYSFFADRTKMFFTNIYNIMNFTIIFYGGMFVLINAFAGYKNEDQRITFSLIVFYAVPVITYILGLFYGYNALHLFRLGEEEIVIEKKMKELAKMNHIDFAFSEWEHKTKKSPGFILAYGTLLMFYIVVPITIIFIFNMFFSWPKDKIFWVMQVIIPVSFWLVYLVFMFILIYNMKKTKKSIRNKNIKEG